MSAETITARIREHLDAGADQVALTILNPDGHPRLTDVARERSSRSGSSPRPG